MFIRLPVLALCLLAPLTTLADEPTTEIDYEQQIRPILSANCTACHNSKEAEGGLNLESYQALLQGGDSGASIVANDLTASYLLQRVNGEEEPIMPPEDNSVGAKRLSAEQIKLFSAWIKQGASDSNSKTKSIAWNRLPENLNPVYALAASLDGQHVAFGHGTTAWVASQHNSAPKTSIALIDKALPYAGSHRDIVQSIAFSPDSQRIATGGYRNVKIWKQSYGIEPMIDGLSISNADLISLSSDGRLVAYPTGKGGVEVVELSTGIGSRFLKAHSQHLSALAWVSNDKLLSNSGGQWKLIDITSRKISDIALGIELSVKQLGRFDDTIFCLDNAGKLYELELVRSSDTHYTLKTTDTDFAQVDRVAIHLGKLPYVGMLKNNGSLDIVDWKAKKTVASIQMPDPMAEFRVDKAAGYVATLSTAGIARLWSIKDGSQIATLDQDYAKQQRTQFAARGTDRQIALIERLNKRIPELEKAAKKEEEARTKLAKTRDESKQKLEATGTELRQANEAVGLAEKALQAAKEAVVAAEAALAAKKKAAEAVSGKSAKETQELAKREQALAAASDSAKRAADAVPSLKQTIATEQQKLDALQKQQEAVASQPTSAAQATSLLLLPNSSVMWVASQDGNIRSYSVTSGEPLGTVQLPGASKMFSLGNDVVLAVSRQGNAFRFRSQATWELEKNIGDAEESPFSDRVTALDFSPDGEFLAVGSGPPSRFGDLKLVSVADGTVGHDFGQAHSDTILAIKFSPNGRLLASAGADKLARIFDLDSNRMVRGFEGHTHHVLGIAWSDDGQTLATSSADKTIKIWNASTGEPARTIQGFAKEVTSLAFSGQTSKIASACADGTIKLYESSSGKQIKSLSGAKDALYALSFSADAEKIISAGQAGEVWTWTVSDGKLVGSLSEF